jgi:hypothetical protein
MATIVLATDEIDLPLGEYGDLDLDALCRDELTTGADAVRQGCRIALLAFAGEWFADLDDGIPWLPGNGVAESDALLGQAYDELRTRAAIRTALLGVPGVLAITQLELAFDGPSRALTIPWEVSTTFGDTVGDSLEV